MSDCVTCTIIDGVADVRLNRPDRLNALDLATLDALVTIGEGLKADRTVRAVILSGEGRAFSAGLDFSLFESMASESGPEPANGTGTGADGPPTARLPTALLPREGRITNRGQQASYVWSEMPAPVIAAIHGHALGGGLQLALGADIRIVSPDAALSVLEVRWGLVPDMTGTQILPGLVGLDLAKELTFTGRMVSGEEAVRIGLATRVSDAPFEEASRLARQIAGNSPAAVQGAKRLLNLAGHVPLEDGFIAEERIISGLIGSPNQAEAVHAYFEKRPPRFTD
ncbi:MAG TPA: crotonase/enoyl-CoA hydratase family protein [Acidimicrobiales bacterium]